MDNNGKNSLKKLFVIKESCPNQTLNNPNSCINRNLKNVNMKKIFIN